MTDALHIWSDDEEHGSDKEIAKVLDGEPTVAQLMPIVRILHQRTVSHGKLLQKMKLLVVFLTGAGVAVGLLIGQTGVVKRMFGE